ncbi:MAG: aldehyde dehydrogenase family protein [Halioglobus sp.]
MRNITAEEPLQTDHWPLLLADASKPAGIITVTSPFDGSPVAAVETCGVLHIEQALATAHRCFRDRDRWLPLSERAGILERTARIMTKEHSSLALQAAREGGKPLADSLIEVTRAIDTVRLAIDELRTQVGEVIPMGLSASSHGRLAFTTKQPIGVVVAVSAFNHPLNLVVHQVAAAIAAGCPVIVKPAEDTPLSCLTFLQMAHRAGLPVEWAQAIVTDDIAVAEKLVTDPRVGFFSFIGSARVGWLLRSRLAPGTRCALEHGGVAPVLLAPDADFELALQAILKGGFYHAGQVCVSVQRIFVPAARATEFAEALADKARKLKVGDPTDSETEVGPLIRPREAARIHSWVNEAVAEGAICLCGGAPLSESLYQCTVLLNPPATARVSCEEIFGPVVCVYAYHDLDDAVERANALPVAFQAAVFTRDIDVALRAYHHLDASAVMVNDHTAFRTDGMPFAGLRQSGLGVGGVGHSIADMQIEKMLVINSVESRQ